MILIAMLSIIFVNIKVCSFFKLEEKYFLRFLIEPCAGNTTCLNGATCYVNIGAELCLCAPGFTGDTCQTNIDECLSSPCLHDGNCIDSSDSYTCDCSAIFFEGTNCEIRMYSNVFFLENKSSVLNLLAIPDPTQNKRTAAFWSVLGIVVGLVVILTLSDLPWEDLLTAIGCSFSCFNCCSKKDDNEKIQEADLRLSDSPINDYSSGTKNTPMAFETPAPKRMNYHVMNTVWNPEDMNNQTRGNPQYNGYRSPIQPKTPDTALQQSSAYVNTVKQNESADKRIYAVNMNEPKQSKAKNPADTMVSWTQQLQEQLKAKKPRETSASSTQQLVHSSNNDDY
jgi:hypothetical protein